VGDAISLLISYSRRLIRSINTQKMASKICKKEEERQKMIEETCSIDGDDYEEDDEANDATDDEKEAFDFVPICQESGTPSNHAVYHSLEDALQQDVTTNEFDLLRLLGHVLSSTATTTNGNDNESGDEEAQDDGAHFYDVIQCINFCRQAAISTRSEKGNKKNDNLGPAVEKAFVDFWHEKQSATPKEEEEEEEGKYFKPVLEDDSYLFHVDDLLTMARDQLKENGGDQIEADSVTDNNAPQPASSAEVAQLKEEVQALKDQLHMARTFISTLTNEEGSDGDESSAKKKKVDNDTYYFEGYSHYSIHETMLRDVVRTDTYRRAILDNADALFKNKVVLDVGCGTGILSLFAAKAGAKKVIAVDNSADILSLAKKIATRNEMSANISFVKGKVENLVENTVKYHDALALAIEKGQGNIDQIMADSELTPTLPLELNETIDVIVSEWMGYALFFETMLPSVMCVRDHFMTPSAQGQGEDDGGTMFPNASRLYLEGASDGAKGGLVEQWKDVYGFDYTDMSQIMAMELTTQATVEVVSAKDIVTSRALLMQHDLNTCRDEELDFLAPFCLEPKQQPDGSERKPVRVDKLVISFDIDFNFSKCASPISFSTGCQSTPTHWKQASLYLDPMTVPTMEKGEIMEGTLKLTRNPINIRELDFLVRWVVMATDGTMRCDGSISSTMSA
jgi:SAM-dependent methyltransferase